jgi:hypothetical protein
VREGLAPAGGEGLRAAPYELKGGPEAAL